MALAVEHDDFVRIQTKTTQPILKLEEKFLTAPAGFVLLRNHFLYDAIDEIIQLTVPMGIPQYWEAFYDWVQERTINIDVDEGPKILAFQDLDFGFVIWINTCGFAILSFICELFCWPKINREKKKREKIKRTKIHPITNENDKFICTISEKLLKSFRVKIVGDLS